MRTNFQDDRNLAGSSSKEAADSAGGAEAEQLRHNAERDQCESPGDSFESMGSFGVWVSIGTGDSRGAPSVKAVVAKVLDQK